MTVMMMPGHGGSSGSDSGSGEKLVKDLTAVSFKLQCISIYYSYVHVHVLS